MAEPINLDEAAAIVSAAFHGVINQPALPTNEQDARPIKIGSVLKGLPKEFREHIYQLIRNGMPAGCKTTLAAEPFIDATYDTIGDILDDIDGSTTCS